MTTLPLTMDVFKNRLTLSKYVYQLHELINTMLGKASGLSKTATASCPLIPAILEKFKVTTSACKTDERVSRHIDVSFSIFFILH